MDFINKIVPVTSKHISTYAGLPTQELGQLYSHYQGKQDKVLNSKGELEDALDMASANLDDEDRNLFNSATGNLRNDLSKLSEQDYVGNLDTKLINQARKFKSMYSQFAENTARKQKFKEELAKSGKSEQEQQMYLNYARQKSGGLQYDPITGAVKNKFIPVSIVKDPDAHAIMGELDNLIPVQEGKEYINPETNERKPYPFEGATLENNYKRKQVTPEIQKKIENRIMDLPYQNWLKMQAELGGKEYAEQKHKEFVSSIVNGLSISQYNNNSIDYEDVTKSLLKGQKERKQIEKENAVVGDLLLPTPYNKKSFEADNIGHINSLANEAEQKGDTERAKNIVQYRDRIDKQFGLKYGKDYEVLNMGVGKTLRILNDGKKSLIEKANLAVQQDAMSSTQLFKTFGFDKESDYKSLDRNLQQSLGNLSSANVLSDDKMKAQYHPEDASTGKPLSKEQLTKMKNVEFGGINLTTDGVYYKGRSSGSSKEQNSEDSSKSDFNFRIKVPNQIEVVNNLVKSGKIESWIAKAYIASQGLDNMFGNYKKIKVEGFPEILVKKNLPSEGLKGEYTIKTPNGNDVAVSYEDLLGKLSNLYKK